MCRATDRLKFWARSVPEDGGVDIATEDHVSRCEPEPSPAPTQRAEVAGVHAGRAFPRAQHIDVLALDEGVTLVDVPRRLDGPDGKTAELGLLGSHSLDPVAQSQFSQSHMT